MKRWDPQEGDIVSFKHKGFLLSSQKPKLPIIYRIRKDMDWAHVLSNWNEKNASVSGR